MAATNEPNEHGQVKDEMGPEGKLMSHEQDVGELSAQNRGGTTRRGAEETKRLEEDDVERREAAREGERAEERRLAAELGVDDEECEVEEISEALARENVDGRKKRKKRAGEEGA